MSTKIKDSDRTQSEPDETTEQSSSSVGWDDRPALDAEPADPDVAEPEQAPELAFETDELVPVIEKPHADPVVTAPEPAADEPAPVKDFVDMALDVYTETSSVEYAVVTPLGTVLFEGTDRDEAKAFTSALNGSRGWDDTAAVLRERVTRVDYWRDSK
jgi:hypothetical protein